MADKTKMIYLAIFGMTVGVKVLVLDVAGNSSLL